MVCKDGSRTFEAVVGPGRLSAVRTQAEGVAKLTDCRFVVEPGSKVTHRDPVPPPPLPEPDEVDGLVPPPPVNVAPSLLERSRLTGTKQIVPDDDTQLEIARAGKDKVVGAFKMCLTADGEVALVSQLRSTGFPNYDSQITREMKRWTYRPHQVNGIATPVCTAVTFIYSPAP